MDGWKGVNDGLIEIENRESIPVSEWLNNLKETKWPAALKNYVKH